MDAIEQPIELLGFTKVPPSNVQVTKAKIAGYVVYIRENVADGQQILELCAPEQAWTKVAAIIVLEDDLKREVRKNAAFTVEWSEWLFGGSMVSDGTGKA